MAFKMKEFSGFKKDPKVSKKRIIKATDFKTPDNINVATENLESDMDLRAGTGQVEGGSANVYRKGGRKYVKDVESGDYIHMPRKEIKRLKKEGSYTSTRKIKKLNRKADKDFLKAQNESKVKKRHTK